MAKTTKRLRYSNGGINVKRTFEDITASLEHYQTQDKAKSKFNVRFHKTEASATRERHTGSPSRTEYEFKRTLGRGFEITYKKPEGFSSGGDTEYGIKYTKLFGKK